MKYRTRALLGNFLIPTFVYPVGQAAFPFRRRGLSRMFSGHRNDLLRSIICYAAWSVLGQF